MSKQVIASAAKMLGSAVSTAITSSASSAMGEKSKKKRKNKKNKGKALISNGSQIVQAFSNAPVSKGFVTRVGNPYTKRSSDGGYCVGNREIIFSNITFGGSTGFNVFDTVYVNPGLDECFTWLPPIAGQFTSYRVTKLELVYVPIAPTSTQGDFIVYPAYNASAQTPVNEVSMVNNKDSITASVWKDWTYPLDVSSMMGLGPRKYVRTGIVQADLKTYDALQLVLATNNAADTTGKPIGKLFFDYEFVFYDPVEINTTTISTTTTSFYYNLTPDPIGAATAISFGYPGISPYGIRQTATAYGLAFPFTLPAGPWVVRFTGTLNDSIVENCDVTVSFAVGGVPLPNTNGVNMGTVYATAPVNLCLESVFIIQPHTGPPNITNALQVFISAPGAGGTISLLTGGSLVISPA
jgi:hypothetical protein